MGSEEIIQTLFDEVMEEIEEEIEDGFKDILNEEKMKKIISKVQDEVKDEVLEKAVEILSKSNPWYGSVLKFAEGNTMLSPICFTSKLRDSRPS